MSPKWFMIFALAEAILPLACSDSGENGRGEHDSGQAGGNGGGSVNENTLGDDSLFVPQALRVTKLDESDAGIRVIALTLREGPAGPELYAAVRNDGRDSACDAAITIEFFDRAERSIAAWIGGLYIERQYRASDGSGTILTCLGPGERAIAASTDLPQSIVLDELGYAMYRFAYFNRDILPFEVVPVDAVTLTHVQSVRSGSGSTFRGTLENGLSESLSNPSVTLFPLNRAGRPLAMATSSETVILAPGAAWTFETTVVDDPGVDHAAYPQFGAILDE